MVLHLPIGVLAALLVLEIGVALRQIEIAQRVRVTLSGLLALTGGVAALTGWVLSTESSYGGETVELHFWLGLASAGLALTLAVWSAIPRLYGIYVANLALISVTIGAAGHLGAELTHGANWLWTPFRTASKPAAASRPAAPPVGPAPAAGLYSSVIAPILEKHCTECHGAEKRKAHLALNTLEGVWAGSDQGTVIDPAAPEQSELLRRLLLPATDDERMPPGDKPPLTPQEIDTLRDWILAGAK